MRRRTAASISWPRLIGIGAAAVVIARPNNASAQAAGEATVGVVSTNSAEEPKTTAAPAPAERAQSGQAAQPGQAAAPDTTAATPATTLVPAAAAAPEAVQAPAGAQTAPSATSTEVGEKLLTEDELSVAGYMPGYRRYVGLGTSPFTPRHDAFAGGITPAYGAPKSVEDWSFKWSGYMNLTLQPTLYKRRNVIDGQSGTTFHTLPMTIDEYASFTSTNTVPGNWVNLNFQYGTPKVAAITSIDTWVPSAPTTYYQLGAQYFINNAYLSYSPAAIGGVRLHMNAGYFGVSYGWLSRYGSGIYVNPIAGLLRGTGETLSAEFDLSDKVTITAEHGIMTPRNGRVPDNVISGPVNGYIRPTWPAAWIHHAHAGVVLKTEPRLQLQVHYIHNWSQDERVQTVRDNPVTRQMNEANIPDGRIRVFAADARMISDLYGYLAAGVAFIDTKDAYPLHGLTTYGGEGENLSDRWLGVGAYGTGRMLVAAVNYGFSVGKLVAHPRPFNGDGPDIVINTGFHWATTWLEDKNPWNNRNRYKGGIDAIYTFLRNVGFGARFDGVVPNSKDMEETFYVLATRIQFKTDWTSREQINLIYAKWFYGSHTRNEGTGERTPERLDSSMLALNFNMWW
jgi:hypothetical protein